jgi:hypothetical protein
VESGFDSRRQYLQTHVHVHLKMLYNLFLRVRIVKIDSSMDGEKEKGENTKIDVFSHNTYVHEGKSQWRNFLEFFPYYFVHPLH